MKNRRQTTYNGQRTKYTRLALTFLLSVVCCLSYAQDIHFTQFFSNPLMLNPANTGYYDGNYRVGLNFKAQWPWAIQGTVYNHHTEAPYFDFSFGEKKIKNGWFGIGANFVNDVAGDGFLTYRRFGLTYAYHQAFDKEHRYILSAGVGANYILRSVDFSKFYFNNQWVDDIGFNTSINSNEPLQRERFGMFDFNAGLNFGAQVTRALKLDFGFSMLHLNRPRHSFLNTEERLGLRYQANFSGKWNISERVSLALNTYYGYEEKASEIVVGSLVGYGFHARKKSQLDNLVYFGVYYRIKDALAPVIGYEYKRTRLLLNYDMTLSKLIRASRANGGPELSLVHVGKWGKDNYKGNKVYCPRF